MNLRELGACITQLFTADWRRKLTSINLLHERILEKEDKMSSSTPKEKKAKGKDPSTIRPEEPNALHCTTHPMIIRGLWWPRRLIPVNPRSEEVGVD